MLTLPKPLPRKRRDRRALAPLSERKLPRSEPPPSVNPHAGMATSHIRNCSDRSPALPCVLRSRKCFAVQSRPARAHNVAKPSRSADSAPRKFWSYTPAPPLARRAAQRETQAMLYSQCTPRQAKPNGSHREVKSSAHSKAASNSRGRPSYPLSLPNRNLQSKREAMWKPYSAAGCQRGRQ